MTETMRGGWILFLLGGSVSVAGLLLAAMLPAHFDQRVLRCGLDFGSNAGVLERSLSLSSCGDAVELSAGVGLTLEAFVPDAVVH